MNPDDSGADRPGGAAPGDPADLPSAWAPPAGPPATAASGGGPGARRPLSWPWRIAIGLGVFVALAVIVGFVVHVPYTTIAPGEAVSLPPRVTVKASRTYPTPRGDIRLLFVRERNHINLWEYVQAKLDSDIDLVKDAAVNPGRLTPAQLNAQGLQQMADAKSAATYVALRAAGYDVSNAPGLTVSDLVPGMPAIKVLHWGDVILSADGRTVRTLADLDAVITKHRVGDEIELVVERDGKHVDVSVPLGTFTEGDAKGRKGIGVVLRPRFHFPFRVDVDTTNIGGPSAGLAMSLAIYDDLTPGDLTGGNRVAVTGTIDAEGNVGEIGGIEQKALSARAAHVGLFIVPQCSPQDPPEFLASCRADIARAKTRAGSSIKVVPVSTFAQALAALRAVGGVPAATSVPSTTTTTTLAA